MLADAVAFIIDDAIGRRIFPGAVVVLARGAQPCFAAAFGTTMYDDAGSRPVTLQTRYDLASLTKMFTAAAALRLVDRGALDLTAPITRYLPDSQASGVTVTHLLTHTSGLDLRLSTLATAGGAAICRAALDARPSYAPGAILAYMNINSLLLGAVVAAVAEMPLDAAIDTLVLEPLGLRETSFCPPATVRERCAPTEIDLVWRGGLVWGEVHDESAAALGGVAGHAGLFGIAADVQRFCAAWLPGSGFLSEPLRRYATTVQTPGMALRCGLGWMMERETFMGSAWRGGYGHTGFTGPAMLVLPEEDLTLVLLSNRTYPQRGPVQHHVVTAAVVEAAIAIGTRE